MNLFIEIACEIKWENSLNWMHFIIMAQKVHHRILEKIYFTNSTGVDISFLFPENLYLC